MAITTAASTMDTDKNKTVLQADYKFKFEDANANVMASFTNDSKANTVFAKGYRSYNVQNMASFNFGFGRTFGTNIPQEVAVWNAKVLVNLTKENQHTPIAEKDFTYAKVGGKDVADPKKFPGATVRGFMQMQVDCRPCANVMTVVQSMATWGAPWTARDLIKRMPCGVLNFGSSASMIICAKYLRRLFFDLAIACEKSTLRTEQLVNFGNACVGKAYYDLTQLGKGGLAKAIRRLKTREGYTILAKGTRKTFANLDRVCCHYSSIRIVDSAKNDVIYASSDAPNPRSEQTILVEALLPREYTVLPTEKKEKTTAEGQNKKANSSLFKKKRNVEKLSAIDEAASIRAYLLKEAAKREKLLQERAALKLKKQTKANINTLTTGNSNKRTKKGNEKDKPKKPKDAMDHERYVKQDIIKANRYVSAIHEECIDVMLKISGVTADNANTAEVGSTITADAGGAKKQGVTVKATKKMKT